MREKLSGLIQRLPGRPVAAVSDDTGATAVEYALLVGLIAVVLIVGVGLFGTQLNAFFTSLADWVSGIMP